MKKRQFCFQDEVFVNKVEKTSHRFEHKVNLLVKMIFLWSVAGPCVWSVTSRLVQWDTVGERQRQRGVFPNEGKNSNSRPLISILTNLK